MCLSTPNIPKAPGPAKQPKDAGMVNDSDQRRRAIGFARTIMTGARGLSTAAPVAGKTLLGS